MSLSKTQEQIHDRAVALAGKYLKLESQLVQVLQEAESSKLYKQLDQPSLFMYATRILKLSEAVAYAFIAVARKSREVRELNEAIKSQTITVSKASKLVAQITSGNATGLIEFAKKHTVREIEAETAKLNPAVRVVDRVKILSEDQYQLTITVSKKGYERIRRLESLEAQKQKRLTCGEALEVAVETYLVKHDPVRKAERAILRRNKTNRSEVGTSKNAVEELVGQTRGLGMAAKSAAQIKTELFTCRVPKRESLTAAERHAVFARDEGKCTHRGLNGVRCGSERWVDVHHIIHVSQGGSNEPQNLTTLCSFHHDLVHQQTARTYNINRRPYSRPVRSS